MPYTSITTAQYNPINFDQIIQLSQQYGQEYKNREAQILELQAKASSLEKLAGNAKDKEQYDTYKNYADELKRQAYELSNGGLSIELGKQLMNSRYSYFDKIKPIEDAYTLREQMKAAQQDADNKSGGMLRYTKRADNMGLSEFMNGMPTYETLNLNTLYEDVMKGAALLSQNYYGTAEGRKFFTYLDSIVQTNGIPPEEAFRYIISDPENIQKYPRFAQLVEDIKEQYNLESSFGDYKSDWMSAISKGLNYGIGYKQEYHFEKDPYVIAGISGKGNNDKYNPYNMFIPSESIIGQNPELVSPYDQDINNYAEINGIVVKDADGNSVITSDTINEIEEILRNLKFDEKDLQKHHNTADNKRAQNTLSQLSELGVVINIEDLANLFNVEKDSKEAIVLKWLNNISVGENQSFVDTLSAFANQQDQKVGDKTIPIEQLRQAKANALNKYLKRELDASEYDAVMTNIYRVEPSSGQDISYRFEGQNLSALKFASTDLVSSGENVEIKKDDKIKGINFKINKDGSVVIFANINGKYAHIQGVGSKNIIDHYGKLLIDSANKYSECKKNDDEPGQIKYATDVQFCKAQIYNQISSEFYTRAKVDDNKVGYGGSSNSNYDEEDEIFNGIMD